jgi:hypothetical protein
MFLPERKAPFRRCGYERIILKWILEKYGLRM